jgi:hypothetical protein
MISKKVSASIMLFVSICLSSLQCTKLTHSFMNIVNQNIKNEKDGRCGEFVGAIRDGGICAGDIIKKIDEFKSKKVKNEDNITQEDKNKEQQKFEEWKNELITSDRTSFLDLFYKYALILRPLIKQSFDHAGIYREDSLVVQFLSLKKSEIDTFFQDNINDMDILRVTCVELHQFCIDLWQSMNNELKVLWKVWLKEQEQEEAN